MGASACLTFLGGCAVGPDFERPALRTDERYTEAPTPGSTGATNAADAQRLLLGQAASPEWWRSFQSAEINQIVQRALDGNRSLAAASYSLVEAEELVREPRLCADVPRSPAER